MRLSRQAEAERRSEVGRVGEEIAARFLERCGRRILDRNVRLDIGEIDLLVGWKGRQIVVEVKTLVGPMNPLKRVDLDKQNRLRGLAARVGASRVELVAVNLDERGADVRWLRQQRASGQFARRLG
jgi:putative endonuclease